MTLKWHNKRLLVRILLFTRITVLTASAQSDLYPTVQGMTTGMESRVQAWDAWLLGFLAHQWGCRYASAKFFTQSYFNDHKISTNVIRCKISWYSRSSTWFLYYIQLSKTSWLLCRWGMAACHRDLSDLLLGIRVTRTSESMIKHHGFGLFSILKK